MAGVSKEEYLKRYLSSSDPGKRRNRDLPAGRKKRKVKIKGGGMRIVDDDVTWKSIAKEKALEVESAEEDEAPVVAEIIDERPVVIQRMEEFRSSNKWKILGMSPSWPVSVAQSWLPSLEMNSFLSNFKESFGANEKFDENADSQDSDQFLQTHTGSSILGLDSVTGKKVDRGPQLSKKSVGAVSSECSATTRQRHDSSDDSPVWSRHCGSPNLSPPRRGRHDSPDLSPPPRGRHDSPDLSPPQRGRHDSPDLSPPRRGRHDSPDLSPPRRGRHDSPDLSPPRRGRHDSPDLSPPRRGCHDSPDLSPRQKKKMENTEKSVRSTTLSYGKTLSPVKHNDQRARGSPQRLQDSNSDLSPPRKGGQHSSDSDLSPPRRKKLGIQTSENRPSSENLDMSPTQQRQPTHKHTSSKGQVVGRESSPSRKSRENEMLSGGQAGLVSTDTLRKEKEDRRKRERAAEHLADDSRNAVTVFRDKLGKKRDLDQERVEQKKKEEEKAAKLEKYAQWGKGVAQKEQQRQNIEDALYEMQKPLARHIDDEDLDRLLRERERDGDPMAGLIRKKKEKEVKNKIEKPRYNGPAPPPNRFNLYPGYRWDGVDRSNGFEKKRFARLAEKKAVQEIAYKWSVEDM